MPIRLVLVDDHPLFLDGLEVLLRMEPDFEVLARCTSGRDALRKVEELKPDVLILELRMPELAGVEVLREMGARKLATRAIVLTASNDQAEIFEAVRLGARGVVLKTMAPRFVIEAVRKVHAGQIWVERKTMARGVEDLLRRETGREEARERLTQRELAMLRMVGKGLPNRRIGERLFVTEGTVKVHLHNIYKKTGAEGRLALVRMAESRGWI